VAQFVGLHYVIYHNARYR